MKIVTVLLFFSSLFVYANKAIARSKEDTIYYLLDTLSTPVRDRIISVEKEGNASIVRVNCHCMNNYEIPIFLFNIKEWVPLRRKVFNTLKLLTLVRLMELTRAGDSADFKIRHVFYIIEPKGKDYVMYRSISIGGEKMTSDEQLIKTGH